MRSPKNGAMARFKARRTLSALNEEKLTELALRYVGRFATTRAKLRAYLQRKVRERGWEGDRPADFDAIALRFAERGYVDDSGYALAKSRSLTGRGYGKRRVVQALRVAGIDEADGEAARDLADVEAVSAALHFAQKRRLGPFAMNEEKDPRERDKALSAMIRAGHGLDLSRAILALRPGEPIDLDEISAR
jgi:regulatory protein